MKLFVFYFIEFDEQLFVEHLTNEWLLVAASNFNFCIDFKRI